MPDGMESDRSSIHVSRIRKEADYEGVRARLNGTLARARIPMQLDLGFGDAITLGPTEIEYPALLNLVKNTWRIKLSPAECLYGQVQRTHHPC